MEEMNNELMFDLPKENSSVIKVIGVGGGGSNAVNHMYRLGIKGVDFVVCNTDSQALDASPVPNKIQLGISLTKGLGAGADPEIGEKAAQENLEEIRNFLDTGTEMVFITAGMGGGTGTGAAPIIARTAREMGVLTVGIVTIPFVFEGRTRIKQAELGIEQMREYVDTLIVVNNNKIREIYGNVGFKTAFAKADEILATASKGISEVITQPCFINIDLNDARTVLKDSGTAIMGTGISTGEGRAMEAVNKALSSPLLNDNSIQGAKKVLLLIISGSDEITFDEIAQINDAIQDEASEDNTADIIMGVGEDESLGNGISVTVIATGFEATNNCNPVTMEPRKVVHVLDETEKPIEKIISEIQKNRIETPPVRKQVVDVPKVEDTAVQEKKQTTLSFEKKVSSEDRIDLIREEPLMEVETLVEEEEITPVYEMDVNESSNEMTFELEMDLPLAEESRDEVSNEDSDELLHFEVKRVDDSNTPSDAVISNDYPNSVESRLTSSPNEQVANQSRPENVTVHSLTDDEPEVKAMHTEEVKTINPEMPISKKEEAMVSPEQNVSPEEMIHRVKERKMRLQAYNFQLNSISDIEKVENEPAYKRQGVHLDNVEQSNQKQVSKYSLDKDSTGKQNQLRSNNSYLHDNVD